MCVFKLTFMKTQNSQENDEKHLCFVRKFGDITEIENLQQMIVDGQGKGAPFESIIWPFNQVVQIKKNSIQVVQLRKMGNSHRDFGENSPQMLLEISF